MHFMCNKYIQAENCHTMMHEPLGEWQRPLTRPLSWPHSEIHTQIFIPTPLAILYIYMYTGNFPSHFFLQSYACKRELCKIQASVIFIYERHWTEAENGRGGPRRRSKAPTESHRINRFPAINQNYGGGTRFLFALALQPCWLNWWQLQSQIEITAFFSVPRVFNDITK